MKLVKRISILLAILASLSMTFSRPAHAYMDSGTLSLIVQVIVAALVGVVVMLRFYWTKVKEFFQGMFGDASSDDASEDSDE